MRKILYNYVPYRLISPFYDVELRQISNTKPGLKNLTIMELSYSEEGSLYSFTAEKDTIIVNDIWFNYLYENQTIINGWLNYKLINYLQKKNPNVPGIPFKLEPPHARKLVAATKYWNEVGKVIPLKDIYMDEIINAGNITRYGSMSIDYFIPWSFVMHDELWNLIPSFKNVNSMKSNRLPDLDWSFERYSELQYKGLQVASANKDFRKLLEDYLTIYPSDMVMGGNTTINLTKDQFRSSLKDTIYPLHQIAYNQGFSIWNNQLGPGGAL